jgi:hypothetical protein
MLTKTSTIIARREKWKQVPVFGHQSTFSRVGKCHEVDKFMNSSNTLHTIHCLNC